jgi:hypothetical protein
MIKLYYHNFIYYLNNQLLARKDMTHLQKSVNALVGELIKRDSSLKNKWKSPEMQTQLKTILTKSKNSDKDQDHPKRAKSPYLYFCEDNRNIVRDEMGENAKATDITKELGVRWQKLNNDTKQKSKNLLKKYEKLAEEDTIRYKSEKAKYLADKNINKGPKRSKSAYLYFCEDKREEIIKEMPENSKVTEITKKLGERWRIEVENKNIAKYEKLAKEDKDRYFEEKKKLGESTECELTGFKKFESEESKKSEYSKLSQSEVKKKISTKWKSLDAKQKSSY